MNKKILAVWFVLLIILFFFLKSGFTSVRVMRFSETQETTVRKLTDWKVSSSGQKDENGNYISTYTIKVPLIHNSSETMMFYTTHSDVSVYVEKEKIYTVSTNLSEKTFQAVRSDRWNQFSVEKAYEGKQLQVVLKTSYKSVAEQAPLFCYQGIKSGIIIHVPCFCSVRLRYCHVYLLCSFRKKPSKELPYYISWHFFGIYWLLVFD